MVQIPGGFNTSEHSTKDDFEPVPPGEYVMIVSDSDIKPTKDGTGQYLWLEHTIVEGEFEGRKVFNNLNLWNKSEKAVKIANTAFTRLCRACGKDGTVSETSELHGAPFRADVSLEKSDGYSAQNRIKRYHFDESGEATVAATAAKATEAKSSKAPPWAQKRA